jgi:hypothetical protein
VSITKRRGDLDFIKRLIKGKIAEIIFQHMLSDAGFAAVIPFGYEHCTPLLAQYQHLIETQAELVNIRTSPDYLLIKNDNTRVALVDVKYRSRMNNARTLQLAQLTCKRWDTAWLFLATPDGFYMGLCRDIIHAKGAIDPLDISLIGQHLQQQYLTLLRDFELR